MKQTVRLNPDYYKSGDSVLICLPAYPG